MPWIKVSAQLCSFGRGFWGESLSQRFQPQRLPAFLISGLLPPSLRCVSLVSDSIITSLSLWLWFYCLFLHESLWFQRLTQVILGNLPIPNSSLYYSCLLSHKAHIPQSRDLNLGGHYLFKQPWGIRMVKRQPVERLMLFSHKVISDSLPPHGLKRAKLPCSSRSPRVCSNLRPLSQWCYLTISSFAASFSFYLKSFPASGSFPSGGQSIGASASGSVLPMNSQGWFPLGLTGLISL